MADNEDDSGSMGTITQSPAVICFQSEGAHNTEPPDDVATSASGESAQPAEGVQNVVVAEDTQPEDSLHSVAGAEGAQPAENLQSVDGAEAGSPGDSLQSMTGVEGAQPEYGSQIVMEAESAICGDSSESVAGAEGALCADSSVSGSGTQLVDFLERGLEEQNIIVGSEISGLGPDLANTTIIYVQPDGTLLDGSGLTAEEQQALLEQLAKQQLIQVSDTEAAQLLQQNQINKNEPNKTTTVQNTALDPSQLQQVINQVTKSKQQQVQDQVLQPKQVPPQVHVEIPQQKQAQTPQLIQVQVPQQVQVQVPQQTLTNASQQLKSVAQQVAMQTSGTVQVVQKKVGGNPESFLVQSCTDHTVSRKIINTIGGQTGVGTGLWYFQ